MKLSFKIFIVVSVSLLACISILAFLLRPPLAFQSNTTITIEEGTSLLMVGRLLQQQHFVRSARIFTWITIIRGQEKNIVPGTYRFAHTPSVIEVSRALTSGDFGVPKVKITIPEGFSAVDIFETLSEKFSHLSTSTVLASLQENEGYLFPDTYFFTQDDSIESIIATLRNNFDSKTAGIFKIDSSLSNEQIVILASIIEEEANTPESRRIVSDILLRRLEINMPLQVDATFRYINGKTTEDLTLEDLAIESPYNTYIVTGLPPTPIANPGLDALKAVIEPIKTPYLYFLTGKDGKMYYAETFEQHKINKAKYL